MKIFMLALMFASGSAQVKWVAKIDGQDNYNPSGFNYSAAGIDCRIDSVEELLPGEKHHIKCWQNHAVIVDRNLHCDRQQVEDFIEIEQLFFGCHTG